MVCRSVGSCLGNSAVFKPGLDTFFKRFAIRCIVDKQDFYTLFLQFFDKRFGSAWKEKDQEFWSEFSRSYQIGKGIQERLKHDPKIIDKGI